MSKTCPKKKRKGKKGKKVGNDKKKIVAITDEDRFTTAFDILYEKEKKFAELIIANRLTRVAVNKSLIIPPKKVITKISKIKDKAKRIEEIMHYIFKSRVAPSRLAEMKDKGGKLWTLHRNHFYPVESDGKVFKLNGIEVKVVKQLSFTTLYKAMDKLTPLELVKEETKPKEKTKKKSKKEVSSTIEEKIAVGTDEDDDDEDNDDEDNDDEEVEKKGTAVQFSDVLYKIAL